ncbi:MAG: methionyl-tRNA formyltransferase [Bacteroidales bacterium]|nr:methionyl-tRNA formyltransferase [Bacteroidales bacterium]MBN2819994.1 methionyl-tRNA formyltransferase [Bacteroidales bacterium]
MSHSIRIVFMGTPDFAVASLKELINNNIKVVGIITAPDKPAGRGKKLKLSPVKEFALENNISPILQPANLKSPEFLDELKALNADLFVVVAFRMLPEIVWSMPRLGTINLHASLLPQYRGAAPINWAIINGENKTGVTCFFIEKEIDTGNIISQVSIAIEQNENAGTLHDKLMIIGAETLVKTVQTIGNGFFEAIPQNKLSLKKDLKSAPKIFKEDCRINWNQNVRNIYNFIRGLSPYPAAWTQLFNAETNQILDLKIFEADYEEGSASAKTGSVFYSDKQIKVSCKNGNIIVKELQTAGKKRMPADAFLRGFNETKQYTRVL